MSVSAEQLESYALDGASRSALVSKVRHAVGLLVAGFALRAEFADAAAAKTFAKRYHDLAGYGAGAFVLRCAPLDEGYLFACSDGRALVWRGATLDSSAIAFLADAVLFARFLRQATELTSLHAAALWHAGVACAVLGASTAGKTTTAIAAVRRGMKIYSDERALVCDRLVLPFPRAINVRSGGMALLAAEHVESDRDIGARLRRHGSRGLHNAPFSTLFGSNDVIAPAAALRVVFRLVAHATAPEVRPIRRYEAISAAARWMQSNANAFERIARLDAIFAGVATYDLIAGTPDATARLLKATVERHAAASPAAASA